MLDILNSIHFFHKKVLNQEDQQKVVDTVRECVRMCFEHSYETLFERSLEDFTTSKEPESLTPLEGREPIAGRAASSKCTIKGATWKRAQWLRVSNRSKSTDSQCVSKSQESCPISNDSGSQKNPESSIDLVDNVLGDNLQKSTDEILLEDADLIQDHVKSLVFWNELVNLIVSLIEVDTSVYSPIFIRYLLLT